MDVNQIVDNILEAAIERLENQEETKEASQMVLDFSDAFKPKKKITRMPKNMPAKKLDENANPNNVCKVDLPEVVEIPENIKTTVKDMQERKVLDLRRWYCMSRPQYSKSCGISSLISCWNFLFSTLGHGQLEPLSQEKALVIIGIEPPFHDIRFGPFTGNNTLIDWFNRLLMHFGLKGKAYVYWKLHGKNRTLGVDSQQAFDGLCAGLKDPKKSYIYHCYNHYMCPIGFELTPNCPPDAYKKPSELNPSEQTNWVIIGEPSKAYPVFHVKKWDDIVLDIDQQNPHFFNIRKSELGVQTRESETFTSGKKLGKNLHCLIAFESCE